MKKVINKIHLWMGLGSGLILFIVCLSGTVYTFRAEIETMIDSHKYYAPQVNTNRLLSADSLITKTEQFTGGKVASAMIPSDVEMNWQISVKKKQPAEEKKSPGKKSQGDRPKTYFVDPYSGKIQGEQGGSTSEFFTKVMQLHRWLLMEDYGGKMIVGVATIIFVFLILSGLVLWFPAKLRLIRQVLTIRTSANWKRINHDLHNTLGFYSFVLLLIMALSGLCWSFEWYRDGLGDVLGAKVFRGKSEKPLAVEVPQNRVQKASIAHYVTATNTLFPSEGNLRITFPENDSLAVSVTKSATGFFASAGPDKVQFDRFTGETLKVEFFSDKPFNVQIADSIRLIHTGEIFGTFSKIIYFIVCLIATSLPLTGTLIWVNKMKKKKSPKKVALKYEQLV